MEDSIAEAQQGRNENGHGRLERSLGLKEALTVGAGIMIGAGIFVFPGLAGGRAGPAAIVSFAIGGSVALLVTLPMAELATAMPKTGGSYHFVSRGLGAFFGALVGLGQWVGLIFASAFYLAGFGFYASDLASRTGLAEALPAPWVALVTGLGLTTIAILGTRKAGQLQDWVVAALLLLLVGFLSYGLLDAFGAIGGRSLPGEFAPAGWMPVIGTAALIFTSYLGFEQIAVLSGEIRRPSRTLPRALMGSVLLVATLYILTMLVVTSFATPAELRENAETALAHVAETILGTTGGLIVSTAGLLATLSSANASVLSSSRAVFAQSRDGLLPAGISRVNRRFRTPHIALLVTGIPIAVLAMLGRIDILAEVASTLHLVMFGLVCLTMVLLRHRSPWWYQPSFRVPAGTPIAAAGGLASFGLIAFMNPSTLLVSGSVLAAAMAWFFAYGHRAEFPTPGEPQPLPVERQVRFLLVTSVPEPPGLPDDLLEAFADHAVVLLGYTEVPEQSSPEQVREELGEEASAALEQLAGRLRDAEIEVDTDLVFTADLAQTLEDRAMDREVDAIILLRPGGRIRRILVPVPEREMAEGLAQYSAWLAGHFAARVELLCPSSLEMESVRERFRLAGVPVADLHAVEGEASTGDVILEAAAPHDLVVLTEGAREGGDAMLGDLTERVLRDSEGPVMVVRLPQLFSGAPEQKETLPDR